MKEKILEYIGITGIILILSGCLFMIASGYFFERYTLAIMLWIGIAIIGLGWILCWYVAKKI